MSTNSELAQLLCALVYDTFNYKIFITDREKVLASSGVNYNIKDYPLNSEYLDLIENRETKEKENASLVIGEYTLTGNFAIVPIISLNDSIGLIIIYSEVALKEEVAIGKLLASIFTKKLDI